MSPFGPCRILAGSPTRRRATLYFVEANGRKGPNTSLVVTSWYRPAGLEPQRRSPAPAETVRWRPILQEGLLAGSIYHLVQPVCPGRSLTFASLLFLEVPTNPAIPRLTDHRPKIVCPRAPASTASPSRPLADYLYPLQVTSGRSARQAAKPGSAAFTRWAITHFSALPALLRLALV